MPDFGHFDRNTGQYVITTPATPRPQENAIFNERYFTITHQTGNGFSRYTDPAGYATTIIAGTEEPAYNTNSRVIYVRDDNTGRYWNVGYYPVCRRPDNFDCRHGPGYTAIANTTDGVSAAWRLFVPKGTDPVELWTLTIRNVGRRKRRLSVFAFAELSLATSFPTYGYASFLNGLLLAGRYGVAARRLTMAEPNPYQAAVFLSSRRPTSREADFNAFVEQFRTLANPKALEKGRCSGAIASRDRVAGVLHHKLSLRPGACWRGDFLAGAANAHKVESETDRYARKYLADRGRSVEDAFAGTVNAVKRLLGRVQVQMGDYELDVLFNQWIPLLVQWGLTSGRWGMLGYRDILQQAQGAAMFTPAKARGRIVQALGYQYRSGHAVRSFPMVHKDSAMRYADSGFWLIGSVTEYLKETGDLRFLKERVTYLDGSAGPVIGHLRKVVELLWQDRGPRGLCLIRQGDWNDSLTHVGPKGRGESVWLSQAFCLACLQMEELHLHIGSDGLAERYRGYYRVVKKALNRHCWDGAWYVRAFDDEGSPVGSRANRQGKIFLNTQAWAILSGTVRPDRIEPMLTSVRKYLRTPYGYMLLYPTYTKKQANIGRITCLEPGCSENASVYTHGNAFLAVALLQLGKADEGFDVIRRIMPCNPENPSDAVMPYQLANGYGGLDHRSDPGKAQFGWSTGSGAWLHQAVVEYLFGLRRTYQGLCLKPCLPSDWSRGRITRRYRGATYRVNYVRDGGDGNDVRAVKVNGEGHDPACPLPHERRRTFAVEVVVG